MDLEKSGKQAASGKICSLFLWATNAMIEASQTGCGPYGGQHRILTAW